MCVTKLTYPTRILRKNFGSTADADANSSTPAPAGPAASATTPIMDATPPFQDVLADPAYARYARMARVGLGTGAVLNHMRMAGVPQANIDAFGKALRQKKEADASATTTVVATDPKHSRAKPSRPHQTQRATSRSPAVGTYLKMLQAGVPAEAVLRKATREGVGKEAMETIREKAAAVAARKAGSKAVASTTLRTAAVGAPIDSQASTALPSHDSGLDDTRSMQVLRDLAASMHSNPTPVIDQSPGLPLMATPAFAGLFADAFIGDADLGLRHPLVTPTLQMLIRFLEAAASGSHQCLGKDSLHVWSVQQLRRAARQLSSVFRGTIALDTRLQATTTASSEFTVRICGEGRPRGIGLRIV